MFARIVVLIVTALTYQLHGQDDWGVLRNIKRSEGKYHYVVALIKNQRQCTGTLISANWVLTAAYCLNAVTHIQYGNMTIPFNESETVRKILRIERPLASKIMEPDLGLVYVNTVPMNRYGQLSAVDYRALAGYLIEYASFRDTQNDSKNATTKEEKSQRRQGPGLEFGEGVVNSCNEDEKKSAFLPYLCIAPKCSARNRFKQPDEPGSPIFYADKLVGVHIGDAKLNSMRTYTPVSPYLSWIHRVISKQKLRERAVPEDMGIPPNYRKFQLHSWSMDDLRRALLLSLLQ